MEKEQATIPSSGAWILALRRLGRLAWQSGHIYLNRELVKGLDATMPWNDDLDKAMQAACPMYTTSALPPSSLDEIIAHRVLLLHAHTTILVMDWLERGCCRATPYDVRQYAFTTFKEAFMDDRDARLRQQVLNDVSETEIARVRAEEEEKKAHLVIPKGTQIKCDPGGHVFVAGFDAYVAGTLKRAGPTDDTSEEKQLQKKKDKEDSL